MLCTNCTTGADLMKAATDLFDEREAVRVVIATTEMVEIETGLTAEDGPAALATAAAVVRLHAQCTGGDAGCGCQHRAGQR